MCLPVLREQYDELAEELSNLDQVLDTLADQGKSEAEIEGWYQLADLMRAWQDKVKALINSIHTGSAV